MHNNKPFTSFRPAKHKEPRMLFSGSRGFTLVEMLIATALFSMSIGAAIGVYVMSQKLWHATSLSMATSRDATMALSRLVYGVATNSGLTNSGLRAASSISKVDSNSWYGVSTNSWYGGTNYYPPQPGATNYDLAIGTSDGSWRLTCISPFAGTHLIDFNKKAGNIVYWMDAIQSNRQLICNYVSNAVVSTNASGLNIQLTIVRREGRFTSTNQVGTFILMRNR